MNGVTPDPSDPIRDGDASSRLKLAQALERSTYAIAWERAWPGLARVLTLIGLFLVVSWAGLWLEARLGPPDLRLGGASAYPQTRSPPGSP